MTEVLATVRFANVSGLPEDVTVNDWSFDMASFTAAAVDGVAASITSFYNTGTGQTNTMAGYLSGVLSRATNAVEILFYDLTGHLDGSAHGSPDFLRTFTLAARGGANNVPSEVAIALSFHGDVTDIPETAANPTPPPAIIRPRARRRGRLYFGPLRNIALTEPDLTEPRPAAVFNTDVEVAVFRFMDERPDFSVWSRRDEVLYPVAPDGEWSVDDAFDTQRRRGAAATTRTVIWP